jgi:hypothetical protein
VKPGAGLQRLDGDFRAPDRLLEGSLHIDRGAGRIAGGDKGADNLVTVFDHRAEMGGRLRQEFQRLGDHGLGASIAERLVELGVAAHVDKQDRAHDAGMLSLACHERRPGGLKG